MIIYGFIIKRSYLNVIKSKKIKIKILDKKDQNEFLNSIYKNNN